VAKILVVDDDPVTVMFLTAELSSMGYDVVGNASHAQEAIEKTEAFRPDLILMDIVLSRDTDGIATAAHIRKACDIPIIFISGHQKEAYLEKIKNLGADGFISKPIESWQLKASIEIALHKYAMDRELKQMKQQLQARVREQTEALEKANKGLRQALVECNTVESELRASEKKYRTLLDTMNEGFVLSDAQANILYVNRKFLSLIGYEEAEVIGRSLTRFVDAEGKRILPKQRALRFEGIFDSYEITFLRKDGTPVYTLISPQVVLDEAGRLKQRFGTITDISALKWLQAAQRRNEAHLRSLMESASHFAIFRLQAEPSQPLGFRVIFVSPSIAEIMGIADPMDFSQWFTNVHPEEKTEWFETLREALSQRDFHQTLRMYLPQSGRQRWVQMFSQSVIDPEFETTFINGIFIDITRQKMAEKEISAKTAHLEDLNTAMKVLLQRRDEDRKAMEDRILQNVKIGILPHVERLQRSPLPSHLQDHVDNVRTQLLNVVSPFIHELSTRYLDLTPTEIQIARYIREGKSSKEIADLMGVAKCTVDTHRNNIRKKLHIANKKENLRSRLMALETQSDIRA